MFSRAVLIARELFSAHDFQKSSVIDLSDTSRLTACIENNFLAKRLFCVNNANLFSLYYHAQMHRSLIKAIDSVGDPPLPIPNREVKPNSADGTAKICGRVGHRHFY